MMENELQFESPYESFVFALRSPVTREKYLGRLAQFMSYVGITEGNLENRCNTFGQKCKSDSSWLTNNVVRYLRTHRERVERRELSASTLSNYIKPLKLFCEQLEVPLPWQRITRGIPRGRRYANDRVPTMEEIRRIVEYPDRRIKSIVYTMASSGIRLGAWNYLKWNHVTPIEKDGKVVAAKLRVYADEEDEYFAFITSEAYNELFRWMDYRKECGEKVDNESWLMRNIWDVTTPKGKGIVTIPKQLKADGIKRLMERALWAQGMRKDLPKNKKRHEFQANHSYRKWFKTRCELAGLRSIVVEILLSHSTGISDSYFRPTETELLQEFLKAADFLTIAEEHRLRKKIDDLSEESRNNDFIELSEEDPQGFNHLKSAFRENILENTGLEQLRFNGVYDKMIESVTGTRQQFYVGVRGNTTRTFDVYFKRTDSLIEKIRTYTGQAELDYTLWTNDAVFLFEAKKAGREGLKRYFDIGWHKFAYAAIRFINYGGLKIYPVYFLRNPKQIFLFVFPQFKFHENGIILNDKSQMTPVYSFVVNLK